jgi:hypothetical protein
MKNNLVTFAASLVLLLFAMLLTAFFISGGAARHPNSNPRRRIILERKNMHTFAFLIVSVTASSPAKAGQAFIKPYSTVQAQLKQNTPIMPLLPPLSLPVSNKPEPKQMACYNPPPPRLPDPNCGDWPPAVKAVLQWLGLI